MDGDQNGGDGMVGSVLLRYRCGLSLARCLCDISKISWEEGSSLSDWGGIYSSFPTYIIQVE